MGFINLEKANDRINMEALLQLLRMYDVGRKLLNGIKSIYVNSQSCVIVKGGGSECFRINSGVYMDTVMKEVKMGMGRSGVRFQEEGREWRLPDLL